VTEFTALGASRTGTVRLVTGDDSSDGPSSATFGARSVLKVLSAIPGIGDEAVAIVNGLFGDSLADSGSRLATQMTIRSGDTVLQFDGVASRAMIAEAVPDATSRICVQVHGLMSTESIWRLPDDPASTYGSLLADDHDMTLLSVRYNTGRHISTNGRDLANLLKQLMRAWPVPVREINLISHSMGGLVVRSACHYAYGVWPLGRQLLVGPRWTSKVRRVVLIGVPNTGAGLEAFVNTTSAVLRSLPTSATTLIGLGLDRRSAGIKDLRFGAIHDEDWIEQDPAARYRINPHRTHRLGRLRRAQHLVIAGTITADTEHPLARKMGDALVTESSAAGRVSEGDLFPGAEVKVFPKLTHNTLAHHPDVYEAISNWW
jgi:triacylglycerol lipase